MKNVAKNGKAGGTMKRHTIAGMVMVAVAVMFGASVACAADAPAPAAASASPAPATPPAAATPGAPPAAATPSSAPAAPDANMPEVPPAAPGVFSSQKRSATRFRLSMTGHTFTSRDAIEKYLAYRAAELTMDQHYAWFMFVENRVKGDTAPMPKPDPKGLRYSFRLEFFRPTWRYKTAASPAWKTWSPFSGSTFFADGMDPKTVTDYQVSADIVLHKGMVADDHPLAFDASAVSDFLINQVSPPK